MCPHRKYLKCPEGDRMGDKGKEWVYTAMLGVCWEDYVNRMGYTIQLALKITLFKLNESNLIQCYTSVDVLI